MTRNIACKSSYQVASVQPVSCGVLPNLSRQCWLQDAAIQTNESIRGAATHLTGGSQYDSRRFAPTAQNKETAY